MRLAATGDYDPPCLELCEGFVIEDGLWVPCPVVRKHPKCVIPRREFDALVDDMMEAHWPERYVRDATWDRCKAASVLQKWLEVRAPEEGLLLHGPVGTGKTMAAALVARELWPKPRSYFTYWKTLADDLAKFPGLIQTLGSVKLLVVDDFGVGDVAPWVVGSLDALFEVRNGRKGATIVTTNVPLDQLSAEPDWARIVDRWRQSMTAVSMPGKSLRAKP